MQGFINRQIQGTRLDPVPTCPAFTSADSLLLSILTWALLKRRNYPWFTVARTLGEEFRRQYRFSGTRWFRLIAASIQLASRRPAFRPGQVFPSKYVPRAFKDGLIADSTCFTLFDNDARKHLNSVVHEIRNVCNPPCLGLTPYFYYLHLAHN